MPCMSSTSRVVLTLMAVLFVVFGLSALLLPQHGCGVPAVEMFGGRIAREPVQGSFALYYCGPIARSGAVFAVPLLALAVLGLRRVLRRG